MIRGVVFDLGGTLMYFDGDWDAVSARGDAEMCAYFDSRGYPLPVSFAENFRALREAGRKRATETHFEYTAEQALNDTLTQHNICWIPDGVLPYAVKKYFDGEEALWRAYEDARALLEILRARGLKLALLSNATDHALIERMTRNAELAEFFDPLLSSAKILHRKPDPRAFQPILDAWQIPAHEIVMVGDAPSFDILGAHRAGLRGVLIEGREPTGASHFKPQLQGNDEPLLQPDAMISQLSELPDVIEAMNGEK